MLRGSEIWLILQPIPTDNNDDGDGDDDDDDDGGGGGGDASIKFLWNL